MLGLQSDKVLRRRSETTDRTGKETASREQNKRWSDLHLTDMVFTHDGIQAKRNTGGRESWKRWSDLQLKQDTKFFSQLKVKLSFFRLIVWLDTASSLG